MDAIVTVIARVISLLLHVMFIDIAIHSCKWLLVCIF